MPTVNSSKLLLGISLFLTIFIGCSQSPTAVPATLTRAATAIPLPVASPLPPTLPPTPVTIPATRPLRTPTLIATMPAPVPLPVTPAGRSAPLIVQLAVPAEWQSAAIAAVAAFTAAHSDDTRWQWEFTDDMDVAALSLVNNESSVAVGRRPLALTIPFTTLWENTSAAEADRILQEGHELVVVMPWSEIPPGRKALRIDGQLPFAADYPLTEPWFLQAEPEFEAAALALAPYLQAEIERDGLVHLAAVGDIMLDRGLGLRIQNGDTAFPFALFASELQAADITVGNLETALGNAGEPVAKSYTFRSPPAAAQSLQAAGFDILSLANNHALDYGPAALQQGIEILNEAGIATVGGGMNAAAAYQPHIITVKDISIAFLSYIDVPVESSGFNTRSWTATANTAGLAWADPEQIRLDVTLVDQEVDLVIVLLHSGFEYVIPPSPNQQAAAQAAVEAGADLILGHHAHILQGIDYYQGGVIVYGLGNFAFQISGPPETIVFHVWLDAEGVHHMEISPAIIQESGQPRPATDVEAMAIRQSVYRRTTLLGPP